jgi:hypothetical protein
MRKFHQGLNSLAMRAAAGSTGLPTLIHWASQALLLLRPRYQMNLHVPLAFFFLRAGAGGLVDRPAPLPYVRSADCRPTHAPAREA